MKKFWLVWLFLIPWAATAQIIDDAGAQQLILKALDRIYNYEFEQADVLIRQIRTKYPQHPVAPVLKAMETYWQALPIQDNRSAMNQYVQSLNQGLAASRQLLERDKNDPEGIFFALTSHGFLALKHNYDEETMKAAGEARKAYGYLKQGLKLTEKNPEFYFTSGLYNYYVERYPMDHPAVKPMMIFFQNGDMPLGLKQMETATRKSVFTRVETTLYLAHIYLEHENQPGRAAALLKSLADKYPNNPLFNLHTAEALILAGRQAEAPPYVQRLKQLPQKFLAMPVKVLEGMLQEKSGNAPAAQASYLAAAKMPFNPVYTKEFSAHAQAGLARLAARNGNQNLAKSYYKKTLDLAEYKSTIREARSFLKS